MAAWLTALRYPSAEEAVEGLAWHLVGVLGAALSERGEAHLALAGGSTPRRLYERLARADLWDALPWERVQLWLGDERAVPPDHPASNQRLVETSWLARVPPPHPRLHGVMGVPEGVDAAERYGAKLGARRLDFALLGIGEDGHTASLFPGGPGLSPDDPPVLPTRAPVAPFERVSLSLNSLLWARAAAFLVLGPTKAAVLAELRAQFELAPERTTLPAAKVRPHGGHVHLFADAEAWPQHP